MVIIQHFILWARVLKSKYKVGNIHDHKWMLAKGNVSATWRSVSVGLREVVAPGANWVLGDERTIRFWTDKWLHNKPLLDSLLVDLPGEFIELRARDLWTNGMGWNLAQIVPYVTGITRLKLAAVVLDDVTGAKDRLSWGSADGEFTVKSAHAFLTCDETPKQKMDCFFKKVWQVVAPERVRLFLWLVAHQAVMTNMERYRRHLGDSTVC